MCLIMLVPLFGLLLMILRVFRLMNELRVWLNRDRCPREEILNGLECSYFCSLGVYSLGAVF